MPKLLSNDSNPTQQLTYVKVDMDDIFFSTWPAYLVAYIEDMLL
jgi:hypothetical protein